MSYRPPVSTARILPLTERSGSPRSDDAKLAQIVEAAVTAANEKTNSKLVTELKNVVQRLETGIERLSSSLEAYVSGEQDVAVASLVDGERDDVPSIQRIKAEAAAVYTLSATDIAKHFGLTWGQVGQLLNQYGLNWAATKTDLWSKALFEKTHRRLWHPRVLALLTEVVGDEHHPDRQGMSAGCIAILEQARR
jgi:hypothetical protein